MLITSAYIPEKVSDVITGMDFMMLKFGFLNVDKTRLIQKFDRPQSNQKLKTISVESESSIVNNINFFTTILFIAIFHAAFILLLYRIKCEKSKFCTKIKNSIFFKLTFAIYIRMALECNQFIMLA